MRIPKHFWDRILEASIHILNVTWTSTFDGKTLYQAFYDQAYPDRDNKPDVSHLRTLGCDVFINIPPEKRMKSDKMAPHAEKGILLGYQGFHLYVVYSKVTKKIYVTPHVVFHEEYSDTADKEPATEFNQVRSEPPHVAHRREGRKRNAYLVQQGECSPDSAARDLTSNPDFSATGGV